MPLKLKVKRRLLARSDRVKSVELHPSQPWLLVGLYNGRVFIWDIDTKQIFRSLDVCDQPIRTARFVARKNWLVTGSDDGYLRVFNHNTSESVIKFQAHSDFIRHIAVHSSSPFILTAGDDGVIKLWDWEQKWACSQVFRGHSYLVMQVVFNPKDNNQFATASLDRSVKVWQLGSPAPNFSLPHEKDVSCLDYHPGGDKPYIVTGEDGGTIRVWDYQTKSCVHLIQVHSSDVNAVVFHPSLPIILSGSSDGVVRIVHSATYRLESSLSYGLERVWAIGCHKSSNNVALGFDEGSMIIRLGQEEPAVSMDASGKIIWAKHSEIQQANIKTVTDQEIKDGERLSLAVKDLGSCEIYPQTVAHSPNGRFVAICGDGEYIIYTAIALKNKSYGTALEFVWGRDSSYYAIRVDNRTVKIFKNFKEHKMLAPPFGADGIFGGCLLGIKSSQGLTFYNWETTQVIRRIEITPLKVFWNDSGNLLSLTAEDSLNILKYKDIESDGNVPDDGYEEAFEVLKEMKEQVRTGLWVGDCFLYTNSVNRLNYCVGGEIVTVAHLDREMYLLGYIPKDNRLYLGDKELSIVSYSLLVSVLEYQTAVMRRDFDTANKVLPTVPLEQRTRIAMFLEKQGFKPQAMSVTSDPDHKFDLALQVEDLKTAYILARQHDSADKWKQLSELAIKHVEFGLAQECLYRSKDFGGLILLSSCAGHSSVMSRVASEAVSAGKNNVAFLANFMLGRREECLNILIQTNRLPEAAFFARTYLPSSVSRVVSLWKKHLALTSKKLSEALADPAEYQNLFPEFAVALKTEQFLRQERRPPFVASTYPHTNCLDRNPVEEMHEAEISGRFMQEASSSSPSKLTDFGVEDNTDDDDDDFVKVDTTSFLMNADLPTQPARQNQKILKVQPDSPVNGADVSVTTHSLVENLILTGDRTFTTHDLKPDKDNSSTVALHNTENTKLMSEPYMENEAQDLDLDDVNIDDFDLADLALDDEILNDD